MIFVEQETWAGDYLGYLARYYADKGLISVSIDYRLAVDSGQKENFKKVFLVNSITHLYDRWKDNVPICSQHPQLQNLTVDESADFLSPLYQLDRNCGEVILFHGECDPVVSIEHSL